MFLRGMVVPVAGWAPFDTGPLSGALLSFEPHAENRISTAESNNILFIFFGIETGSKVMSGFIWQRNKRAANLVVVFWCLRILVFKCFRVDAWKWVVMQVFAEVQIL